MKKFVWLIAVTSGLLLILHAQDFRTEIDKSKGKLPAIAIPDLRGSGETQAFMGAFNQTLWADVSSSGVVNLVPKTMYPLTIPQQPSDFTQPPPLMEAPRARKGDPPRPTNGGGRWMVDWSGPP